MGPVAAASSDRLPQTPAQDLAQSGFWQLSSEFDLTWRLEPGEVISAMGNHIGGGERRISRNDHNFHRLSRERIGNADDSGFGDAGMHHGDFFDFGRVDLHAR